MEKRRCPAPKLLVEFFDRKSTGKKFEQIAEHIKTCKQCLRNVKMLNKIESILSMPDNDNNKPHGSAEEDARGHIGLDLLYGYLTGKVTEAEKRSIQGHLNSCSRCYHDMTSLVRNSQTLPDAQELEILRAMQIPAPEDQVAKLMAWSHAPFGDRPTQIAAAQSLRRRWTVVKDAVLNWGLGQPGFNIRAALVVTTLLALVIIGGTQFSYLQSIFLTQRSLTQLTQNYSIDSRTVPRPSGGFDYAELTRTRGQIHNEDLNRIPVTLHKALNHRNPQASQYLATYYLVIEHDLNRASQYYHQALARDSSNARVLNDLGTLAWQAQNLQLAQQKFQRALVLAPNFPEARYNLALVLEQLGQVPEAIAAWQNYLALDRDTDWARIAQEHLDRLTGESKF